MSLKSVCDLCGIEIDPTIPGNGMLELSKITDGHLHKEYSAETVLNFDTCPSCLKKVTKLIKETQVVYTKERIKNTKERIKKTKKK